MTTSSYRRSPLLLFSLHSCRSCRVGVWSGESGEFRLILISHDAIHSC